jgi:PAS domain S-box-containing protein
MELLMSAYEHPGFYKNAMVISEKGVVIGSVIKNALGANVADADYFRTTKNSGNVYVGVGENPLGGKRNIFISSPIETGGVFTLQVNLDSAFGILAPTGKVLGDTGEVVLVNKEGLLLSPVRFKLTSGSLPSPLEFQNMATPAQMALSGRDGIVDSLDYRGARVLAAYRFIPISDETGWGMVVKQDYDEIFKPEYEFIGLKILINFLALLVVLGASSLISKSLSKPIESLSKVVKEVGKGNYNAKAGGGSTGEVGLLVESINHMTDEIRGRQILLNAEIAQRKRALDELLAREAELSEAQKLAHLGSWDWDLVKNKLRWSEELYQIFRVKREDFRGTYEAFVDLVHPEDKVTVQNHVNKAIYEIFSFSVDHRIVTPGGEVKVVHNQAEAVFNASGKPEKLVGTIQDITERKQLEQRMADALELTNKIVSESPIPIAIYDESGECVMVNKASVRAGGGALTELLRNKFDEIGAFAEAGIIRDGFETLKTGVEKRKETRISASGGRDIWLEILFARIMPGGKPHLLLMLDDVTEKREAAKKLLNLNKELEEAVVLRTSALNAANKELEAFSYSVSHDLRAPLRAIDGFSLALLEDFGPNLDDKGKDYLRRIRAGAVKMSGLIDDMLLLSRITRDKMHLAEVDISGLAEAVAGELKKQEPERGVEFIIEAGINCKGDPKLIRIALENLMGNAWKFTTKTANPRIEFGKTVAEDKEAFFVRDNGAGFDSGYKDMLFLPFHRLHTNAEFEGTGIGLATVKRIITRHGGQIWGEGEVGKGAVFYFTI